MGKYNKNEFMPSGNWVYCPICRKQFTMNDELDLKLHKECKIEYEET